MPATYVISFVYLWFLAHAAAFVFHHETAKRPQFVHSIKQNYAVDTCLRHRGTDLCMARTPLNNAPTSWFPPRKVYDDDIFRHDDEIGELEERSIELVANLIQQRLRESNNPEVLKNETNVVKVRRAIAKGRFFDLTCNKEGEQALESLFDYANKDNYIIRGDDDIKRGAVIALQSLLVMGTQVGVKGPPEQLKNMVAHLWRREDDVANGKSDRRDVDVWDADSIRRLKHGVDQTAGTQILARLKRKQTTQGAFDLLVDIGAWEKHEDLALLRSGFPIHFTEEEEKVAQEAASNSHDPDKLLGLRKDLRRQKVYTIDSASTTEIDDGLSVEVLSNEDGSTRQRFWIHIADGERWAPPSSKVFEVAQRRITSLYLPTRSLPMFPSSISDRMSLNTKEDLCALSLGVELLPDGSIDASSIIVTPSRIEVDYRLSYDEVDEMLEEGIGYNEEWQLGALLAAAKKRRTHRIENGSTEGMVPNPIPQLTVSAFPDDEAPDGMGIELNVEPSNNSGMNQTEVDLNDPTGSNSEHLVAASPASLLVTEMMILAGEAIGKWKIRCDAEDGKKAAESEPVLLENTLRLPFRSQSKPDYKSRQKEVRILNDLRQGMQGGGYCHAWYARRFFKPVQVNDIGNPHFGLGLDCYVQWSSPIRRCSDLQVHAAIKRYLRRKRVNELVENHELIPPELTEADLGCKVPVIADAPIDVDGRTNEYVRDESVLDDDIDYNQGAGLMRASRVLQRKSQEFWVFEYLRRLVESNPEDAVFDAVVLGCVNPEKYQYAVYIHKLGLEHRYLSEVGALRPGMSLSLRVSSVYPRLGLLTFTLSNK